ncbi:hypothetical protein [Paenibacillus sp. NPDC058177]|uniref:hypothetical protein n=1 Tax=Paenibacillus sp. NPDC058177 TaxID=3346369 RepID=UPI0036D94217
MTINAARSLFDEYCHFKEINPLNTDETLLLTARDQVLTDIALNGYTKEAARLMHRILSFLGDAGLQEREHQLRLYLREPLERDERFWAHWELVDTLALLKKCKETVAEQLMFLHWTKANCEPKAWPAVMFDGTQAHCWACVNRMTEWFDLYYNIINSIESTEDSRKNRASYIRTAGEHLVFHNKMDEAMKESERLMKVVDESAQWPERVIFWLGATTIKLEVFRKKQDWESYDQQVQSIMALLETDSLDIEKKKFIANDFGACLLWAGRYQQAQLLFESNIKHGSGGITHYFLAICIWSSKKDRTQTLHHLAMAENEVVNNLNMRGRYIEMFKEQPEFSDIWDDQEFLSVISPIARSVDLQDLQSKQTSQIH